MEKYQILARRYRPQRFSEVVGQEAVVTTLKNALRFNRVANAYLFSGSRGVGKTTLARLFAKALNCERRKEDVEPCNACSSCQEITHGQSLDVIEIDGASNRGIDDIRAINETIGYVPSHGKFKVYIIDEVHMLTKEAFNALLKTLEEPPPAAKFFFATTEAHKVLPTILSRCQRFDLPRLKSSQIIQKLKEIASDLSRDVQEEALHQIARFSEGSLRDAESLLDQILCFSEEPITKGVVQEALGLISSELFFQLDHAFSKGDLPFAPQLLSSLLDSGKDLTHFFSGLIDHYRFLTECKIGKEEPSLLAPEELALYKGAAKLYLDSQLLYILEYLLRKEGEFSKSAFPDISLEVILLHIIRSKERIPPEVLVRRLSELEQRFSSKEPTLHQEELKNGESEREGLADRQGASETKDLGEKPVSEGYKPTEPAKLEPVPFDPYTQKETPPVEEPMKRKAPHQQETLMRFAAIELEGTLKK